MAMTLATGEIPPRPPVAPAPAARRVLAGVLDYWRLLAAAEGIPPRGRVEFSGPPETWENAFIVRVASDPKDFVFESAGPALRRFLGRDPVARRVADVMPAAIRARILFVQKTAMRLRSPVDEVGSWRAEDGQRMRFRMIVAPLSDDQVQVNYLLGAFIAGLERAI